MVSSSDAPVLEVPSSLLRPSPETQQQLLTHLRLLHLLHHRSKNQHKSSLWYRHFDIFRREVRSLCNELQIDLGPGFSTQITPVKQAKVTAKRKSAAARSVALPSATNQKVTARLKYWISSDLISCCYTAFSTLATTPSFSPLALSLLAILARICSLTGITAHLQAFARLEEAKATDEDQEQLTEALERFAQEDAGELFENFQRDAASAYNDLGVPILRNFNEDKPIPPPKKRRKKANAIDDLFDGL